MKKMIAIVMVVLVAGMATACFPFRALRQANRATQPPRQEEEPLPTPTGPSLADKLREMPMPSAQEQTPQPSTPPDAQETPPDEQETLPPTEPTRKYAEPAGDVTQAFAEVDPYGLLLGIDELSDDELTALGFEKEIGLDFEDLGMAYYTRDMEPLFDGIEESKAYVYLGPVLGGYGGYMHTLEENPSAEQFAQQVNRISDAITEQVGTEPQIEELLADEPQEVGPFTTQKAQDYFDTLRRGGYPIYNCSWSGDFGTISLNVMFLPDFTDEGTVQPFLMLSGMKDGDVFSAGLLPDLTPYVAPDVTPDVTPG